MGFAKDYLKNSLSIKMIDTYWQMVLSGGGGGGGGGGDDDGGNKPFDELTWDQVIASTKTGKYKTFPVGAMKELDLGTEGIVHMQIVGIDADNLADGSGKAPLTFISKELLNTRKKMNPTITPSSAPYDEGTGAICGWGKSEMRTYLKETIKPLIPEKVRGAIQNVTKYSNIFNTQGTKVLNSITSDDVWIPSNLEIFGGSIYETSGCVYDVFASSGSRTKQIVGSSDSSGWWLRSAYSTTSFRYIKVNGASGNYLAANALPFPLGFCL